MRVLQVQPSGAKGRIACFFRQTFRRHTGAEYCELLTRGMNKDDKGVNRQYPWAYLRLASLIVVLLAVFLLIVRFTYNELFEPTIIVLASTCFNLSSLVLLYELYPEKDISLMSLMLAMLLGGAGANVVTQILFNLFPSSGYLKAVLTGFFEELPKAAAALVIILVAGKRSPLAGLLFGAAVGCGFSVAEDMGYIFQMSNELPWMNLTTIIEQFAARGVSSMCTHILWTGLVGWAVNYRKKSLAGIMFYVMLAFVCGLHICWDLPVNFVLSGVICGICATVVTALTFIIVYSERVRVFKSSIPEVPVEGAPVGKYYFEDAHSESSAYPSYWSHASYLALMVGAVFLSVVAIVFCAIPFRETIGTQRFKDADSFVAFMQDDIVFNYNEKRAYNSHGGIYTENKETINGIDTTVRVVQKEDGIYWYSGKEETYTCSYLYEYSASYDFVSNKYYYSYEPLSVSILMEDKNGVEMVYVKEDFYANKKKYASFFRITDKVVQGFNVERNGAITVYIRDEANERNLLDYLWLFATIAAVSGASIVCFVSLKIKGWRIKKLCSTKSASSAE